MREAGDLLPNLSLPFPTKILAHDAKRLGAFGLVGLVITNRYQSRGLSLSQPQEDFTNHYHRTGGERGTRHRSECRGGGVGYNSI